MHPYTQIAALRTSSLISALRVAVCNTQNRPEERGNALLPTFQREIAGGINHVSDISFKILNCCNVQQIE